MPLSELAGSAARLPAASQRPLFGWAFTQLQARDPLKQYKIFKTWHVNDAKITVVRLVGN